MARVSRLAEGLSRLFGHVEILARGGQDDRRAAEQALQRGDYLEARACARSLLAKVPRSPVALALLAEASEQTWHHHEVVEALAQLAEQVPWRQELWLKLGEAGLKTGWEGTHDALERAANGREELGVARRALLTLADQDLLAGDHARASRWLDRIPSHPQSPDPELALRRIECALAQRDEPRIQREKDRLDGLDPEAPTFSGRTTLGARRRLVRAQLARTDPSDPHGDTPLGLALGAYLLDAPGAEELVAELLTLCRDAAQVAQVREALAAVGESAADSPRWRAAFALAEGRADDARKALLDAARLGDETAARSLLSLCVQWQDHEALGELAKSHEALVDDALKAILAASEHIEAGAIEEAIAMVEGVSDPALERWCDRLMDQALARWRGAGEAESEWQPLLKQLRTSATQLDAVGLVAPIEALAVERDRPLVVAVLGEFNAGKSTLLNALLGTDVAPTGVMPTTASLHWVAWAPDPFARVVVRGGTDRVVPHADLKKTLRQLRDAGEAVQRVLIYAPIERLKRIEILDTPGFNAPETTHAEEARRGIEEAHLALWLLDATAPLKESERQIIEQVAEARVPIQVLVNKRDRVGEEAIEEVMAYVVRALEGIGIVSLTDPIALSARQALEGRLGDQAALDASHWMEVEAMLEEGIVNRSGVLRERALRRKAARIAEQLDEVAAARAREHHRALDDWQAADERRTQLAMALRGERASLSDSIMKALEEPLDRLWIDARPIEELSEERRGSQELRNYLVDRCVERLAPTVVAAIVERGGQDMPTQARAAVTRAVASTFAGAAAAHRGSAYPEGDALRDAVARAVVAAAEEIDAAVAPRPADAASTTGTRRRLGAMRRCLLAE
jgi:small GTP-binding protein